MIKSTTFKNELVDKPIDFDATRETLMASMNNRRIDENFILFIPDNPEDKKLFEKFL